MHMYFLNVYVFVPEPFLLRLLLEFALWLLLLRNLENGMLSNDDFLREDGLK